MHWTEESIGNIRGKRIPHRNYERALSDGMAALVSAAPSEVVCITGPSRVGKSRLAGELTELIAGKEPIRSDGSMPVVNLEAANCSVRGQFSTKSFTVRALEAIRHPIYGPCSSDTAWDTRRYQLLERTAEGILRPAFEFGLKHRRTRYLFIDEAQHIIYAPGGAPAAAAILDSWKCLAATTQTVLVLIGAYPLLDVLKLCPHLLGRKHQIHLPRYYSTRDDLLVFESILDGYTQLIRLPPDVGSLRRWNKLLYDDSFGCLGLLELWLRAALAVTRSRGEDVLTKDHLLAARRPLVERRGLAAEIEQGERALMVDGDGTAPCPSAVDTPAKDAKPQTRPKPFQKRPRRYSVGGRN